MYSGRPYGRFSKEPLSDADIAAIERLARVVTNLKGVYALENFKRVTTLPSGRTAVAVDMGGTFRIIVSDLAKEDKPTYDGLAHTYIPMLFSGAITKHMVLSAPNDNGELEGVGVKLTEQCRRRLTNYNPEEELPPKDVNLVRFRIEYGQKFKYFEPQITGIYTFTQYHRHRPTWYSGAMTEVVQIVGGYGRQDFSELPDKPLERKGFALPSGVIEKIEAEMGASMLPGYSGVPDPLGQYQYDYKFSNCDAVAFDEGNNPWLLNITSRGVYAMPLPMIPATTTDAFRRYIENVGDSELLHILDRFGGLPSGEAFPEGGDFEAWRRAGVIIEVCDTSDFYNNQSYYDACGWSFNSRGTEGYNTCWEELSSGLKMGYAYKMQLKLAPASHNGLLPTSWHLEDQDDINKLNTYLSSIYRQAVGDSARSLAVKYKLRRFEAKDLLRMADDPWRGFDYWDSLELDPIANHAGSVTRVSSGPIWWPKIVTQFGIAPPHDAPKFPTLTGEGCETFDMINYDYEGGPVRCDTIVWGCYVDDSLKVIKYFRDERESFKEEEGNFQDLMIVGSWEKTVTTGATGLMGKYYTSDDDDRAEVGPTETHTKLVGKDLGYGTPRWHTPEILVTTGTLSRARYYEHRWEVHTKRGFGVSNAVLVPVFSRDCLEYAYREGSESESLSIHTEMKGMSDSTSYSFWTYDPIFHWMGRTGKGNPKPEGGPKPYEPDWGTPVWLDEKTYVPSPGGFADSGDWFGLGGGAIDVTNPVGKYTRRGYPGDQEHHVGGVVIGGKAPGWQEFKHEESEQGTSSGRLKVTMKGANSRVVHRKVPNAWYWQFSPVEAGGSLSYFYQDATWITSGEARYSTIYTKNDLGRRYSWGRSELADYKTAQHFIGAINE